VLAPTSAAPARAREVVSAWLDEHRLAGVAGEAAVLVVSELVTNAIRHARIGRRDAVRLTVGLGPASVRLAVHDAGTEGTVAQRPPEYEVAAGGFGLQLVERLTSAWGVQRDAAGTTVWAEFAIGSAAD
jgi:serine/threonine-protein kinase RsbW